MQPKTGRRRVSREQTLSRIGDNPTWLEDRKMEPRDEVGEVGMGFECHNKESEFDTEDCNTIKQQSDMISTHSRKSPLASEWKGWETW